MSQNSFNNLNVANTINTTNIQCDNLNVDSLSVNDNLSVSKINLTTGINDNITVENLNSLDTTSSITSQFINAKNYTDEKINLLLNNPDVNINSISELFNILGNNPNLNVVNSLADKISKSQENQTITALNMNFTNPVISSDFTIKNSDNTTKSVKSSISSIESGKLNSNLGVGTNNVLYSPLIAQHLYVQNANINQLVKTKTECWNIISSNLSSGQKELNFLNFDTSYYNDGTVKAFVFHKLNNSSTNAYDDFFIIYNNGNGKLKGDLIVGSNNISLTGLNTNLSNNYYTKTQIDDTNTTQNTNITNVSTDLTNNYYTKTQIDDTNTTQNTNLTNLSTNLTNNYYNRTAIDYKLDGISQDGTKILISKSLGIGTNPTAQLHVLGNSILNGNATVTGSLNVASVSSSNNITTSNNVVCLGLMYSNVLQCNSGSTLTLNRDFPNGITNVIGKLGVNVSSPSTALDVNGDVNASGNINASSLTIDTSLNVKTTLTQHNTSINSNSTNILNLINYNNLFPKYSFCSANVMSSYGTTTKSYGIQYLNIRFQNKNLTSNTLFVLDDGKFVNFRITCRFHRTDMGASGETSCNIMFFQPAFALVDGWGGFRNNTHSINNDISGAGAYGLINRPYWTYNQTFNGVTGSQAYLAGMKSAYNGYPLIDFKIWFIFPTDDYVYSITCEALDISNAIEKNMTCTISSSF